ncbi:flagellar basal-body MS-ring/collar protein FliF [Geomicrobium sediminis]|uniref:Flagellar M-ring protein n=1 Tax=Geomicrobium sediminis TaxID=1347788 RepID=A0ABS2PB18_9BACL|nr:flagellar basal-body MS-ring/collar protein FliF [Geomicrobium sediminis]MBM7632589.1 flagellar M-ring protein FliF [Geomicrobium sediminis]
MNERLIQYRDKITGFWTSKTRKEQGIFVASFVLILVVIMLIIFFTFRTSYAPLYSNMSVSETGQIKETLDSRGVPNEIRDNGTTIFVPEELVDNIKVELAAEGLPATGSITYDDFRDSLGFGMTDNEFSVMEKAAMQSELETLIQTIDGVQGATVMIQLPEETIWLSDEEGTAQASVVVTLAPGMTLDQGNVQALYNLVSKSIPNLPTDNIVITDQLFNSYFYESQEGMQNMQAYDQQREVRRTIENDLQQRLQQMLGLMMGQDKVVVSVTADVDFTQEYREEELIEPVDEDATEGIAISAERVSEYYEGQAPNDEGVAGTGEDDIANYPGVVAGGDGDYERMEDRINYDVNRIHRQIQESPYKIRDLGVQVVVEPPVADDPMSLPPQALSEIESMLESVVMTSIDQPLLEEMDGTVSEKILVTSQPLYGKADTEPTSSFTIPTWAYVVTAVGIIALVIGIVLLLRRNREEYEEVEELTYDEEIEEIPTEDLTPSAERKKKLEQLARERPEEFSKLLRTWLSED